MSEKRTNVVKATIIRSSDIIETKKPVKKDSTQKVISSLQANGEQYPPFDFELLADIYGFNGYHGKCIGLKAIIAAGLGYQIQGIEENQKEDEEYKKLDEFIKLHPSYAGQTFTETLINFQTDFEIFGSAYFELARNKKKEIQEIYHIPGKDCRVIYKNKETTLAQKITAADLVYFSKFGDVKEGQNEFVQLKNYNPKNRFYGMPEYMGTLGSLMLDRNATEYNIHKFNNHGIPGTIITLRGGQFGIDTQSRIKEFFQNNVKGVKNAGRSLILESEDEKTVIDVKLLEPNTKDVSYRNLRIDARDEVIAAHGVPKMLLGIAEAGALGQTSRNNAQLKIFQDCVIDPRQTRLEFLLNDIILKQGLNITKWRIKLNSMYVEDPGSDAQFYQVMAQCGILTSDEIREDLGYDALSSEQKAALQNNLPPVSPDGKTLITKENKYYYLAKLLKQIKNVIEADNE